MTAPTGPEVLVIGRDAAADRGAIIGVFEILDLDLRVVATGVLRNDQGMPVCPFPAGRYFARARLVSGHRISAPFEVAPADDRVVAEIEDVGARDEPAMQSGDGWLAGWRFDPPSGSFAPSPPRGLQQPTAANLALSGDGYGGTVLIQWAVKPHAPLFTAAIAGMSVRFVIDASTVAVGPASSPASALMSFLQAGDVPAVRTLLATLLSDDTPPDAATAVAIGYCMLRCGDTRVAGWARDLAHNQPDCFDAHLINASALLRDADGWPHAREHLLTATRHGLPLYTQGLRLLDDELRLLIQGTEDQELTAARQRFVPYLRACLNRPLTTFWGTDPATPAPMPTIIRKPAHSHPMQLERLRPTLRPARTFRTVPKPRPSTAMLDSSAVRRTSFGPYTVPVVPTAPDTAVLTLPSDLAAPLGEGLVGAVAKTDREVMVMISNVVVPDDNHLQVLIGLGALEGVSVELRRQRSALVGAVPWQEPGLPDVIRLSGFYGRRPAGIPGAAARQAELVVATAVSRKTAMVKEAERLTEVTVGWEDAAARLVEIAEQWPTMHGVETATDKMLWRRFVAARKEFERRHSPTVVIDARPRRRPADPRPDQPANVEETSLSVQDAELRLRDLLGDVSSSGPAWEVLGRAATAYCLSTVLAWLTAGHIPRPCKLDRRARAQLERAWSPADAAAVAGEVAESALAHFRDRRVRWGLWRVENGIALSTELLDGCAAALPAALRAAAGRRGPTDRASRPARRPDDLDPKLQSAAMLRDAGYSRAEVAELLGFAGEAAVTRAVARFRRTLAHDEGRSDV
jgi:hypothetical protein